jgi:hypothetical protein
MSTRDERQQQQRKGQMMGIDTIQRIDLDIVETILKTQIEQCHEMKARAVQEGHEFNRASSAGAIMHLEQVLSRLAKVSQKKRGKQ